MARVGDLPPTLMRSITWDQGTEMARHLATTAKLGAAVYFCDSRSPWQRGSNENTHGLLRDYFPQGRQPRQAPTPALAGRGTRTQPPPPHGPSGPLSGRAIHCLASLTKSVSVATLTRTRQSAAGGIQRASTPKHGVLVHHHDVDAGQAHRMLTSQSWVNGSTPVRGTFTARVEGDAPSWLSKKAVSAASRPVAIRTHVCRGARSSRQVVRPERFGQRGHARCPRTVR